VAIRRSQTFTGSNRPFIVPVAIDGPDLGGFEKVPDEFKAAHVVALAEGRTTPEFRQRILSLVMEIRRKERHAV
jgi:hypothetical protein